MDTGNRASIIEPSKSVSDLALFIGSLSHEIKTPLNGLIGYLQILESTKLDKAQSKYVVGMNQCAYQLMQVINDILDYSNLTAGKSRLNMDSVLIEDVRDNILKIVDIKLKKRNQTIRFIMDKEVQSIVADRCKVEQILINLLTNAINYSPNQTEITVSIKKTTDTNELVFSVADEGNGISPEDITSIFDPFVKKVITNSGNGLGLTICKKLVNLMGGDITVKSTLGVGSVFSFNLQYQTTEEYDANCIRVISDLKGKPMLVTTSPDKMNPLIEIFSTWNIAVLVCAPFEALRMVAKDRGRFHLCFIDMNIPDAVNIACNIKDEVRTLCMISVCNDDYIHDMTPFDAKVGASFTPRKLGNILYKAITARTKFLDLLSSDDDSDSYVSSDSTGWYKNKILVVDDSEHNREVLCLLLSNIGYQNIETAVDGEECIEMLKTTPEDYSVIFLDLRMPKRDGFAVLDYMNSNQYNMNIVVVVTSSISDEDRAKCKEKHVKHYTVKPIDGRKLGDVVSYIMISNELKGSRMTNLIRPDEFESLPGVASGDSLGAHT